MFSTTILIAIQMKFVKHLHVLVALAFFLVFGFLDGQYQSYMSDDCLTLLFRPVLGCRAEENSPRRMGTPPYWYSLVRIIPTDGTSLALTACLTE